MIYRVRITPRAQTELYRAALWWDENRDHDQAVRWMEGFEAAIASLTQNPERYAVAAEDGSFPFTLREILYGVSRRKTHRAVFEVRAGEVIVHGIRHSAQRDLTMDDLEDGRV